MGRSHTHTHIPTLKETVAGGETSMWKRSPQPYSSSSSRVTLGGAGGGLLYLLRMPLKLGLCCGSGAGSALPAARSLFCSATPLFL